MNPFPPPPCAQVSEQFMKEANNHNAVVYRHPLGVTATPRRRGYRVVNLDDRSSQYRAMIAHLRATDYPKQQKQDDPISVAANGGGSTGESLFDLSRRYDAQASRNFVRDAALLGAIAAISGWAFVHTVQAIAGS